MSTLRIIAIAAIIVVSPGRNAQASVFDNALELIKRAANYTRNNPRVVADTGLLIAAVTCVAFIVYKSRAEPRGATPLEEGDWADIEFIQQPVVVQTARIFTPAKVPKLESVTAKSPELTELIFDLRNRQNRIVGLNSQPGEL